MEFQANFIRIGGNIFKFFSESLNWTSSLIARRHGLDIYATITKSAMGDALNVVGLAVSLPGLAVNIAELYKLTVTARKLYHDMQTVGCRISIEHFKCRSWLEDVGLATGNRPNLRLSLAAQDWLLSLLKAVERT